MILPPYNTLPENLRTSLSKAAIRMLDIANELLSKVAGEDGVKQGKVPTLISADLLEIITEKKYEYRNLPLNFTYEISQAGYFAFIDIDARVFKRTLSNLINNAVDAQDKKIGKINIHLEVIKDKILNNIAITFGKPVGNGLGFSQIREALYNNGGELSIESELG